MPKKIRKDEPINKISSGRKIRGDMKMGDMKHDRPRKVIKQDITKDEFLANLGKVCRPIGKESNESDLEKTET